MLIESTLGFYNYDFSYPECFNDESRRQDWEDVLVMLGLEPSATHVCLPDFQRISETSYSWEESQYSIEDDRVVVTELRTWEDASRPADPVDPESVESQTGEGSLPVASWCLIISLLSLLF